MVIKAWSRMLRLPNLILIVFTQVLIYVCFILANFQTDELALNLTQCVLFLLTLLCIASSGYVINNIYDSEIDSLDIEKAIIPNHFTKKQSWQLYAALSISGLILAIYISYKTGFHYSFLFYPISVLSLWLYSYKLKCLPLFGNILIALMTSGVIAIIPFVFWVNFKELRISDYNSWAALMYRFVMLCILAVLSNLAREVIKDVEDVEMDQSHNCHSTANYFGVRNSNFMAMNIWLALLIICCSALWYAEGFIAKIWNIMMLGIPALAIFIFMIQAKEKTDFSKLSLYIKLFMFLGILYWCVIA